MPLGTSNKNDNTPHCNFITRTECCSAQPVQRGARPGAMYHLITRGSSVMKGTGKIMFNVGGILSCPVATLL